MAKTIPGTLELPALTQRDIALAKAASQSLAGFVNGGGEEPLALRLSRRAAGQELETDIPAPALRLLFQALCQMAAGDLVTVTPLRTELSAPRAADLLGLSRRLIEIMDEGKMPYRTVSGQRRVRYSHLLAYLERERRQAPAELAALFALAEEISRDETDGPAGREARRGRRKKGGDTA